MPSNWQRSKPMHIPLENTYNSTKTYVRRMPQKTSCKPKSTQKDHNFNVNKINRLQHEFPDLTGEGMLVSIQEPLFDTIDLDLRGRFVATGASSVNVDAHATSMTTLIAGAGNSFTQGRGVAWKANFTSSDNADTLPQSDSYYQTYQLGAQNHSYGIGIETFYGKQARAFDLSANNNETLLHLMSSGNKGTDASKSGTYQNIGRYATLTGNFKMAKNILTIGNIDAKRMVNATSSAGPAHDGRVKPELVAYGGAFGGTSNATAITTGVVTLLQQAYKQKNSNQLPSATLLKAVLINSAEKAEDKVLSFKAGYGSVNAYRAHQTLMQNQYFNGTVTQGNTSNFSLTVPANAANLKITVVWNDPAANSNASQALVNDLDLTVTHVASNTTWQPWVLNTAPNVAALSQPATRGADHLNNVELVTVDAPSAGTYTIQVKGHTISTTNQSFYVAYQWDIKDQFSWNFPRGSDNMPYHGEQVNFFRWEASFNAGETGKLEYSIDNGQNWWLIDGEVKLDSGFYKWEESINVFSLAMARMTVGNQVFVTDTFTFSKPLSISRGFNCGDSVMIKWPKASNIEFYEVYTLGDKYLKQVTQTTDTMFVFNKTQRLDSFYTVVPHFNAQRKGIMSATYDYHDGAVDCYIESFYATSDTNISGLVLKLNLGTIHQVQEVRYERLSAKGFELIGSQTPTSPLLKFIDAKPFAGKNTYRAQIIFNNGRNIPSDPTYAYYLEEQLFLFYPNPVPRGKDLIIQNKEFGEEEEIEFILYNIRGQILHKESYKSDRLIVKLENYPSGLYYYKISGGGVQKTGKIILN